MKDEQGADEEMAEEKEAEKAKKMEKGKRECVNTPNYNLFRIKYLYNSVV